MPRLAERYTLAKWTNDVIHVPSDGSSITDSSSKLPPAGVVTASGERPATSVRINYLGGSYGTADRCERGIGMVGSNGLGMVEGGIYWADLWQLVDVFANSSEWHNDWSQVRDSGLPDNPSPSPAFSCVNGGGLMLRNLWQQPNTSLGPTLPFEMGSMGIGAGNWIHWQLGFRWSESPSNIGWFEVWRNGVRTVLANNMRTARETSGGASWRFGCYRSPTAFGDNDTAWWLWGLEIWNERPSVSAPPVDPPPTTTRPALPSPSEAAGRRFGNMPAASGQDWFAAGDGKKRSTPIFTMGESFRSSLMKVAGRGILTGSGTQPYRLGLHRVVDRNDRSLDDLVASGTGSVAFNAEAAWISGAFTQADFPAGDYQITLQTGPNEVSEWGRNPVGGLIFGTDAYADGLSDPFGPYTTDTVSLVAYLVADPVPVVTPIDLEAHSTGTDQSRGNLAYDEPDVIVITVADVVWRLTEEIFTDVVLDAIRVLDDAGFVTSLRPIPYHRVTGERLARLPDGTYTIYVSGGDPEP